MIAARRRVVLLVVDGLRADLVTPDRVPALAGLATRSRVFTRHTCVFPSATRVNSASLATGCYPARHGLHGNAIALDEGDGLVPVSVGPATFRERWRRATGATLRAPTLSERLRKHGGVVIHSNSSAGAAHMQDPDGHGTLLHRDGSHGPGFEPVTDHRHPDVDYDAAGDREVTRRFVEALSQAPPAAVNVLWICEPDHSQHVMELGSPEHQSVLEHADGCVAAVAEAVDRLRARGEEVLFLACSDHGHETVSDVVPVESLLIEAGVKEGPGSHDVVIASSGMGALIYLSEAAMPRRTAAVEFLTAASWCDRVFAGDALRKVGLPSDTALQVAFSMAKQDVPNRFGVRGLGAVAADPFMKSDARGLGQHGGLGPYETRPFLIASGPGVEPGPCADMTGAADLAPTILEFLSQPRTGTDGQPLRLR